MKKSLRMNLVREFQKSGARFFSLVVLVALGVFVLIGLKVTGSDMRQTANAYYRQHKLADAVLTSNVPLTHSEQQKLRHLPAVKQVEFSTYQDAVIPATRQAIRIESQRRHLSVSRLTAGRLPQRINEIALDQAQQRHYHLGQTLRVVDNHQRTSLPNLSRHQWRIVGFITSSDYIEQNNFGATAAGSGQLKTFGVVVPQAFKNTAPLTAKINFRLQQRQSYAPQYEQRVRQDVDQLTPMVAHWAQQRQNQLQHQQRQRIQQAQALVAQQRQQMVQQTPAFGRDPTLHKAAITASRQLAHQQRQIQQRQQQVKQLRIIYQLQSRNDFNEGYSQMGEDAHRIDLLANVFPILFFSVAILVCSTTMARMAEEKRIELGTLRALGYSKFDSIKVFIIYGLLAGTLGTILGTWLGTTLLPTKIYLAYAANFTLPALQTPFSVKWTLIAGCIALACTTLPAVYTASRQLREKPAILMLPKPPAKGAQVWLEHWQWLWNRLSFNYEVTWRNLVRYKGRTLMTILGVCGCTALLITGFGIRDSVTGIVEKQYQTLIHYDVIGLYNPQASRLQQQRYRQIGQSSRAVQQQLEIHFENVWTHPPRAINNQPVSLLVPLSTRHFDTFVTLQNPTNYQSQKLTNSGAFISEKLAQLWHLKSGQSLTLRNTQGKQYRLKIAGITQMYVGHWLYLTPQYYQQVFHHSATSNGQLLQLKVHNEAAINQISWRLNRQPAAVTVVQSNAVKQVINNILNGLNNLVIIITLAASALAFVVLFTLTNINVSERIREISTIKVLGFYPREVVLYIYREVFILTLISIALGMLGGYELHHYIMQTLPPDIAMVDLTLRITNFLVSGSMTIIFSMIVMAFMAQKIKHIDMLGALKSVD